MRFSTDVDMRVLPAVLPAFFGLIGWPAWETRVRSLRDQVRSNPLCRRLISERYSLELAVADLRERHRKTHRYPHSFTSERHRAFAFAVATTKVHAGLTAFGQKALVGKIRGGLNASAGLAPIAHEFSMATHFVRKGFDVQFLDLETGGGFDLLATRGGLGVEVECKHVTGDIGRKVRLKELCALMRFVFPALKRDLDTGGLSRLLRVVIPDALPANFQFLKQLADEIVAALTDTTGQRASASCTVSFETLLHEEVQSKIRNGDEQELETFLAERYGIVNSSVMIYSAVKKGTVCVSVESAEADSVVKNIHRSLKKDSKRQFTKRRPAVLCIELSELTPIQLQELYRAQNQDAGTAIQRAINDLLVRRPHLHTVALTVKGDLHDRTTIQGPVLTRALSDAGWTYFFTNPHHPLASDARLQGLMSSS